MAIDKLVIEIDGNASGLTKALATAQKNLTTFNSKLVEGNRAVNGFVASINKGAGATERLAGAAKSLATSFSGLSRSITSSAASIARLGTAASAANNDLKAFSSQLSKIAGSFERMSGASKSATAAINSLQRRVAALSATVSTVNSNMRTFNRTVEMATAGAQRGGVVVNNYGKNVEGAGRAANSSAGMFTRLHKANITLMEGFRRHVAQITALRTLVYQGLFWFSPLVYSIIKVNAQYEKQIQLLKNLSGATTENAKMQYALQTRAKLVQLANTNPFSLDQITESFVRMKVSGLDPLNGGLQTLMDSIAAFGGGNDELQRAGIALQQMVGKSAVSMEELRQQLGEHIPDAMKSMAAGMGLSMAKFYKAVQSGTVESVSAINNMMVVLNNHHRGAALAMMNTWNGLLARMSTAWQNFVAKIAHDEGQNSFIQKLKDNIQQLIVFLNTPAGVNFGIEVQNALAAIVVKVSQCIKFIYEWRSQIIEAAKIFAIMWGGKLVFGTILSLIGVVRKLVGIFTGVIAVIRVMTGTMTAAAAAARMFGAGTAAAGTATKILEGAVGGAAGNLALLATRFGVAAAAAGLLAGAIWLVVSALNAKTAAERNELIVKSANSGGTYDNQKDQLKDKNDLIRQKQDADWWRKGGWGINPETGEREYRNADPRKAAQLEAQYNRGAHGYNTKLANTRRATDVSEQMHYTDQYGGNDPYAATRAKFNDQLAALDPNSKTYGDDTHKIEEQQRQALLANAQASVGQLQGALKNAKTPNEKKAIQDLLNQRVSDVQSFAKGFTDQKYIQGTKKPKKKGEKRDPLEKYRDKYASAFVSTADLEHQYSDLVNHTSTEFDAESAQLEGDRRAKLLKTAEALKVAAAEEKARQEEIRKSIKVQTAINKIEDDTATQDAKNAEDRESLALSYDSVNLASKHFSEQLMRENRVELEIAQARMASGKATADNVRQYKELTNAINSAIRAKQAELVLAAAHDAKTANEEYDASFRSPAQQANYEAGIEYARYSEALRMANNLTKDSVAVDEDLAHWKGELVRLSTEEANANNDVLITAAKKHIADDEAVKDAQASIPILQRRLDILTEESNIRNKFHGAGGPLFDWATKASSDFQNLGESMGSTLTGAMDDFISSMAEGKMAFADFAKTVLKQLILIIIRGLIAKAILSALGLGWSGSSASTDFSGMGNVGGADFSGGVNLGGMTDFSGIGVGHSGMMVGGSAPAYRHGVDAATFAFANRYHTGGIVGLGGNEVPIIAQKGEGVFTKEQMKALGGNSKGSNVQVNVINQTGQEADVHHQQPRFDGEKWIETIILKKMAKPGPVRDGLNSLINKR